MSEVYTQSTAFGSNYNEEFNTQYQEQAQGGTAAAQTGGSANSLTTSQGDITVNQESPQAILALQGVANNALNYNAQVASGTIGVAAGLARATQDALEELSATPAKQLQNFIVPLVIGVAVIVGIIYYRKG